MIVSTFGPEGPTKCSGRDIIRYNADSLHNQFGARFTLMERSKELRRNPTISLVTSARRLASGRLASRSVPPTTAITVASMRMFDFGNTVIMTALHAANAGGRHSYAVRMFVNEGGDWKIALSAQTDIKRPAVARN